MECRQPIADRATERVPERRTHAAGIGQHASSARSRLSSIDPPMAISGLLWNAW